jgi:hypothetical protein
MIGIPPHLERWKDPRRAESVGCHPGEICYFSNTECSVIWEEFRKFDIYCCNREILAMLCQWLYMWFVRISIKQPIHPLSPHARPLREAFNLIFWQFGKDLTRAFSECFQLMMTLPFWQRETSWLSTSSGTTPTPQILSRCNYSISCLICNFQDLILLALSSSAPLAVGVSMEFSREKWIQLNKRYVLAPFSSTRNESLIWNTWVRFM